MAAAGITATGRRRRMTPPLVIRTPRLYAEGVWVPLRSAVGWRPGLTIRPPVIAASELVRRCNALGDGDFGRSGLCSDRAYECLQLRIGKELLEVLGRFPLVVDHHEAVANAEAVVDAARGLGLFSDLGEFAGPVGQRLAERRRVSAELAQHENAHESSPP